MRVSFIAGALAASIAAGPIVSVSALALSAVWEPANILSAIAGAPVFLVLSILFGFPAALIPNVLGSAALAYLGTIRPVFRRWAVWAAAGFLLGTAILTVGIGEWMVENALLGMLGAVCALICRYFTVWDD